MAKLKYRTISRRTIEALAVEDKDAAFWYDKLPGFGVRVYPTGSKVYVVQTRLKGRSKRITLGRQGVISVDKARHRAAEAIALIKSGQDPEEKRTSEITAAELAERYIEEHVDVHCKPGAYRGLRQAALSWLNDGYEHVERLNCERSEPNKPIRQQIVDVKREFTSEIQDVLDIRKTYNEIRRLAKEIRSADTGNGTA